MSYPALSSDLMPPEHHQPSAGLLRVVAAEENEACESISKLHHMNC